MRLFGKLPWFATLACEPPEQRDDRLRIGPTRTGEAKKRSLVESISEAQVGRYLREAELQPHKSR
jgi:hypothetical protein